MDSEVVQIGVSSADFNEELDILMQNEILSPRLKPRTGSASFGNERTSHHLHAHRHSWSGNLSCDSNGPCFKTVGAINSKSKNLSSSMVVESCFQFIILMNLELLRTWRQTLLRHLQTLPDTLSMKVTYNKVVLSSARI
ncbi:hypothetical protein M758_UG062600 [Ceratodon purpureus]|nr:hypothetical protein M758_UG062600 [Ceratodon purpureus]